MSSFQIGPVEIPFNTDANGNPLVNFIPRTGTATALLQLVGSDGELGSATDRPSLIRFRGANGEAAEIAPFQNTKVLNNTVVGQAYSLSPHYQKILNTGTAYATITLSAGLFDGQEVIVEGPHIIVGWQYLDGTAGPASTVDKIRVLLRWNATLLVWQIADTYQVDGKYAYAGAKRSYGVESFAFGPRADSGLGDGAVAIGPDSYSNGVPGTAGGVVIGRNSFGASKSVLIGGYIQAPAGDSGKVVIGNFGPADATGASTRKTYVGKGGVHFACDSTLHQTMAFRNADLGIYDATLLIGCTTDNSTAAPAATSLTSDGAAPSFFGMDHGLNCKNFGNDLQATTLDRVIAFRATIIGHEAATNDACMFVREGLAVMNNTANTLSLIGAIDTIGTDKISAGFTGIPVPNVVTAGILTKGVDFQVTGLAGKIIRWSCKVELLAQA